MPDSGIGLDFRVLALTLAVAAPLIIVLYFRIRSLRRQIARHEDELRAERNKLKALFDAIPDPVWIKSPAGVYRECNDHMIRLLARDQEDIVGHRDDSLFPPESAAQMLATDSEAIGTGKICSYVALLPNPDGSLRQLDIRKAPLHAADGSVTGIIGEARDITERLRTQETLRIWAHAFQHAGFGIKIHDIRTGSIVAVNPVFARERGYSPEEMIGMPVDRLYPEHLRFGQVLTAGERRRADHEVFESTHVTRSGRQFPVLIDRSIFHDDKGDAHFTVAYVQDISARKRTEDELRLAEVAFQSSAALVITDPGGSIKRVNQAFLALTGYPPEEVTGRNIVDLIAPDKCLARQPEFLDSLRDTKHWENEHSMRICSGSARIVRTTISPVIGENGGINHYVVAIVDLTREHEARANLRRATFTDQLTGLSNRHFLTLRLRDLLERSDSDGGALLLIDIDHFKRINDLHGHALGDRLIVRIAERLRPLISTEYILSRFNGGTFALLVPARNAGQASLPAMVAELATRLCTILSQPFARSNPDLEPIHITVSIGWASFRRKEKPAESILKEAELAMYEAKTGGRNGVRRFEFEMELTLQRRETFAADLARTTQEAPEEIELHLQLQTDRQGNPTGAEVLARWNHRDGHMVLPDQFIAVAEERGLIVPLGTLILRRACRLLHDWKQRPELRHLSLSVNISPMQLARPEFVAEVTDILKETGANPHKLTLEITETAIMEHIEETGLALARLRSLGVRISLDDFGIGYSSLHYLARLPLDQIKIDRSFVQRLSQTGNDTKIAQAIIGLGHGLGLEVIAEGIETDAQGEYLLKHGCDRFQGFLLSPPIAIGAFEKLLRRMIRAGSVPGEQAEDASRIELPKEPERPPVHMTQPKLLQ